MIQLERVLASLPPGDPSGVLATAQRVARHHRAHLELLDVVSDKARAINQLLALRPPEDIIAQQLAARRNRMASRLEVLREEGFDVSGEVAVGIPAIETVRAAMRASADLVVVGRDPERSFFGGPALRILRNAPCPVWIAPSGSSGRPHRILAAIDPFETGTPRDQLDRSILEHAATIASAERAQLHVVHVWNTSGLPAGSSARVWQEWRGAARAELQKRINRLVDQIAGDLETTQHLVEGEPAEAITSLARRAEIDLIVMGTVARTGVAGFLIGNTAEEVVQEARCSLLSVKPSGFVSPVEMT